MLLDAGAGCHLAGPPELHHPRIGAPPLIDDALQLVFRNRATLVHALHGSAAALVATGQLRDFALLPQLAIDAVLDDRHVIHL